MRLLPDELVAAMYADYQIRGMTLAEVGKKYGRHRRTIDAVFRYRGFELRPSQGKTPRLASGRIAPLVPKTKQELEAYIQGATKVRVPAALDREWRKWSWKRRREFLSRMRTAINSPDDRPKGPFSRGLTPFDYCTPAAREIINEMNRGRTSREATTKIDVASQGVIYKGLLWFWSPRIKIYQRMGKWTPEDGRPSLHRVIWEEWNGRNVPSGFVVVCADGNKNNLSAANLELRTKNDIIRQNQAAALFKKARETTALLLARSQDGEARNNDATTLKILRLRRAI